MNSFGETGQAIWDVYEAEKLDAGSQALVRELARTADTCDRLDGLAAGRQDTWVSLTRDEMGEVHLSIDRILDEQRKSQLALKALYAEVRAAGVKPKVETTPKDESEQPVDALAALREEKAKRERQSG